MSKETIKHDDQEMELRKLLDEVQQSETDIPSPENNENKEVPEEKRDVDILDLPPRKEVHSHNKKRTRFKISSALVRLFTVIIILVLLLAGTFYLWGEGLRNIITNF